MTQAAVTKALSYVHRSYSQINQLRKCGYQFKLERIDKVPSRPMVNAVAGKAVHAGTETVDDLMHDQDVTDRERLILAGSLEAATALGHEVQEALKDGWPVESWRRYPRQGFEWFRDTGIPNSISAYVDWRLNNPDFVLAEVPDFGPAIEVPFNYYNDGQLIHGWIDRVFTSRELGGYYPVDLKSGKKPATDEQLGLYAAALHKALGWNVEWGFYLYQLKSGEAKQTAPQRLTHWTDEKLGQVYLPATKMIDLGIFIPSPGENCQHCGVSEACPFAQAVV